MRKQTSILILGLVTISILYLNPLPSTRAIPQLWNTLTATADENGQHWIASGCSNVLYPCVQVQEDTKYVYTSIISNEQDFSMSLFTLPLGYSISHISVSITSSCNANCGSASTGILRMYGASYCSHVDSSFSTFLYGYWSTQTFNLFTNGCGNKWMADDLDGVYGGPFIGVIPTSINAYLAIDYLSIQVYVEPAPLQNPLAITGPVTIGTTNAVEATLGSWMRRNFYANGRHWVTYPNASNYMVQTSSTDGATWTTPTALAPQGGASTLSETYFPVWFNGTYLMYVQTTAQASPPIPTYFRMGTPNADGSISWLYPQQQIFPTSIPQWMDIKTDSQGYIWITWDTSQIGAPCYYQVCAIKNALRNGQWQNGTQLTVSNVGSLIYTVQMVPEDSGGKMIFLYQQHASGYCASNIYSRLWDGSTLQAQQTVGTHCANLGYFSPVWIPNANELFIAYKDPYGGLWFNNWWNNTWQQPNDNLLYVGNKTYATMSLNNTWSQSGCCTGSGGAALLFWGDNAPNTQVANTVYYMRIAVQNYIGINLPPAITFSGQALLLTTDQQFVQYTSGYYGRMGSFYQANQNNIIGLEYTTGNMPPYNVRYIAFDPPKCIASASPTDGYSPLTVHFSSTCSEGVTPYRYYWNFGDGAGYVFSTQNPNYTYQPNSSFCRLGHICYKYYYPSMYVIDSQNIISPTAYTYRIKVAYDCGC